ncbi:MAG: ABC transporter permease subunit [Oscillospiraceae bacterium]|nr:ABC transporter permease subunit [Oscillospiraceae bacterium]
MSSGVLTKRQQNRLDKGVSGTSKWTLVKRYWVLYVMLILPMAYFVIFRYLPMEYLAMAFKENNIIKPLWEVPWVGLKNFERAFGDRDFWNALRNTFMLNILDIGFGFPAPIILAIILNELVFKRFKRVTQTIAYMPHFLSWVIIYGLAMRLFAPTDGLVNILMNRAGYESISFFDKPNNWVATYVFLGIWQSVGWNTIIYLAAITNINPELYEAAAVDGAGRLRRIWHITLPGIKPTIVVLLILTMGGLIGGGFERPWVLRNPMVYDVATVLPVYVYTKGLLNYQFSLTTAVGMFQSVVGLFFVLGANFFARKVGERGLW